MAKGKGKSAKKQNNKKKPTTAASAVAAAEGGLMVDPARVRFQHSKIRPIFSGCGRSVEGTLEEIRQGRLNPSDLPPIQVIVGPSFDGDEEPWYFSLNNRRLWVLKRCREEGLLPNNQIFVRVRKPKSEQEAQRYSLENCALEAKIIPEKPRGGPRQEAANDNNGEMANDDEAEGMVEKTEQQDTVQKEGKNKAIAQEKKKEVEESSYDESSDDDSVGVVSNRFNALF